MYLKLHCDIFFCNFLFIEIWINVHKTKITKIIHNSTITHNTTYKVCIKYISLDAHFNFVHISLNNFMSVLTLLLCEKPILKLEMIFHF